MRAVPLGREEESATIYNHLKKAIETKEYGLMYVSGMPGCGKTYTCAKILEIVAENYPKIHVASLNCGSLILPSDIFLEMHRTVEPSNYSSPRILEEVLKKESYSIFLVDEIDMLISKNQNILYGLLEIPSATKNVYIIAISNTYNLPDRRLTQKVRSRLGWNRVNFPIYKKAHLVGILRERGASKEFTPEAIDFCAGKVSALNGDVRKAFQIQKYAIDHTNRHNIARIDLAEVDSAMKYVFHSMQSSFIRALSEYQKIILLITSQKGHSYPCTLFNDFKTSLSARSLPPISFKDFQGLVSQMTELGALKGRINSLAVETRYIPDELDLILAEEESEDLEIMQLG
ncbi:origin recognition complex subunit 1 [Nematocida displodere]|uniref:Origin recognition complex subunit 1 n=1 Tax=Nematocida displodere TaxID=1805483 RepID=A0A177EL98_9MICR|nr:origin recognition complex subunit 1 [Nematocida displodere]